MAKIVLLVTGVSRVIQRRCHDIWFSDRQLQQKGQEKNAVLASRRTCIFLTESQRAEEKGTERVIGM